MGNSISEIRLVLSSHLAFYRRHPWLIALFVLGLSLGSALLTAIAGLNQEAQNRYQASSALISNPVTHFVKPLTGTKYIDGSLWINLRRLGMTNAQPVLRGTLKTEEGRSLAIQGVNTLLWLNNERTGGKHSKQTSVENSFLSLLVDAQFAQRLITDQGDKIPLKLQKDRRQPDLHFVEDIGLWALTDLATADYLLDAKGQLSFIELSELTETQIVTIKNVIAGKAQLVEAEHQNFSLLSEAFFFNLTALAMLGYIVAAFLSFNAIKLTLTARKKLLTQMHLLGCTKQAIGLSLLIELITLSLFTALLGTAGGYFISNLLVLDINRTLVGLYDLDKALIINWQWSKVLLGFGLNLVAMAVILLSQSKQISKFSRPAFFSSFAICVGGGIWLFYNAATEYQALLLCLCILTLFILFTPRLLQQIASLPIAFTSPLAQWLHADTRFHVKELHVAIVAILVALGTALSMQIMVKSFAVTLDNHLEKQLSADIYLRTDADNRNLRKALDAQPEVTLVSIYQQSMGSVNGIPATLESFGNTPEHYQHISLTSGAKVSLSSFKPKGCLANEQSAIKFGVKLGSLAYFTQNEIRVRCRISGFFYDYGNPRIKLLTLEEVHNHSALHTEFIGYSIRLKEDYSVDNFSERLVNTFEQDSTQIYVNQRFKRYASELFNDTFVVTKILNGFILAIALISLCTSLLSLSTDQLEQLSILHKLGVTQTQLWIMKLSQTALVVLFTTLLSLPLGFVLGWVLLKYVMPIAFGWTIHFNPDLPALGITCLTLVAISTACAYLPIRMLTKVDKGAT
ncbi:ABC transporter permease [Alteromonas sp. ASW11-130]|uniref:ABC transporter permease n=1 Tax=Alteromonas sp. ASW11-130 TaxID=3015775 RepID=UPI002241A2B4|nr:ABC transporter permease [Alteromonas sp. ASW11-130]MCW8091096.1 ABC transporter permease [Alteromonas sp. ASW11-130]